MPVCLLLHINEKGQLRQLQQNCPLNHLDKQEFFLSFAGKRTVPMPLIFRKE